MADCESQNFIDNYLTFLEESPSSFHAAHEVASRLEKCGFILQKETDTWNVGAGGHVVIRDGGVIAYFVPDNVSSTTAFRIVGAHTDSPCLVVKPTPSRTTADGWGQICVEIYGGMLLNSWLDRELCVAGRIITTQGQEVLARTGPIARIPQLAIHLDRTVTQNGLKLNPQTHMQPVWTVDNPDANLLEVIAQEANLPGGVDDIDSCELILVPSQAPDLFGENKQFVSAGRQDNLSSVFTGLAALERIAASNGDHQVSKKPEDILVFACFDNEEIGSATRSGAAGPFLEDVLQRTASCLGLNADETQRMFARSSCLSSDSGHSVHPNYPEYHDPETRPVMGRGPMLKLNANRRYASDAVGTAIWNRACRAAHAQSQAFVSKNDMPCGSTIGPITSTRLGITTVDIGIGLLAMHSARELSHVDDLVGLSAILEAYWRAGNKNISSDL